MGCHYKGVSSEHYYKKLGFDWLINLKRNQTELLAESERAPAAQAPHLPAVNQFDELRLWYAPQVDSSAADRDIGVVKTVRTHVRRVQRVERDPAGNKQTAREPVAEQSTNFYATNLQLGSIPPLFLHQLGRSRWQIDAEVFQTITKEGALQQPSLRQGYEQALVVLTMIRGLRRGAPSRRAVPAPQLRPGLQPTTPHRSSRAMSPCLPLGQRSFHEGTAAYSPNHPSSSLIPSSKLITRNGPSYKLGESPVFNYLRP